MLEASKNAYDRAAAASNGQIASPREPDLRHIENKLSALNEHLLTAATRLANVADSLYGGRPQSDTGKGGIAPVRSGVVGQMEDRLDHLAVALEMLNDQIARFDRLT